jgi:hypothetical protein
MIVVATALRYLAQGFVGGLGYLLGSAREAKPMGVRPDALTKAMSERAREVDRMIPGRLRQAAQTKLSLHVIVQTLANDLEPATVVRPSQASRFVDQQPDELHGKRFDIEYLGRSGLQNPESQIRSASKRRNMRHAEERSDLVELIEGRFWELQQ